MSHVMRQRWTVMLSLKIRQMIEQIIEKLPACIRLGVFYPQVGDAGNTKKRQEDLAKVIMLNLPSQIPSKLSPFLASVQCDLLFLSVFLLVSPLR